MGCADCVGFLVYGSLERVGAGREPLAAGGIEGVGGVVVGAGYGLGTGELEVDAADGCLGGWVGSDGVVAFGWIIEGDGVVFGDGLDIGVGR